MMERNIYLDGVMGVAVGDALGCPVEFVERSELDSNPVKGMEEYGTHNMPCGTWTDDTSMTMATVDALRYGYSENLIQENFVKWLRDGRYTATGVVFDVGSTCSEAIYRYAEALTHGKLIRAGLSDERSNGNGSLMRIMPVCLYMYELEKGGKITLERAIETIHEASSFTHAHRRSLIACGLYYFIIRSILEVKKDLVLCIRKGLKDGFEYYEGKDGFLKDLSEYNRLRNPDHFMNLSKDEIKSSGYVVDTLEAAVWSLMITNSFEDALLTAVNLGADTDTVAAVTGGLAGLYYSIEGIPVLWLNVLQRKDWIEKKCVELYRSENKGLSKEVE